MNRFVNVLRAGLLGTTALVAVSGAATAADLSFKDEPAVEEARKFGISAYVAGTTDYVFRGVSQTDENPTVQGALDITYGILYAGVWASGLDFDDDGPGLTNTDVEIDFYAGVKPTWNSVTFDFGFLYYYYPGADDNSAELDYVELKAGISGNFTSTFSGALAIYYSPDFSLEVGESVAIEGTVTKTLPKLGRFDLAISGTLGYFEFDKEINTDYTYGNVGITATKGNYSLDVRLHASDLDDDELPASKNVFQADERVVGTLKVTLP